MLPVALAGMSMKRFTTPLITRFGYRRVLVGNTLMVGITMASFALSTPSQPLWWHIVQLAIFGAVNSLQFTAMNTVTLKDLNQGMASSGNSLLSMVQMVAMGMGVAAAGGVLSAFTGHFGSGGAQQTLWAFQGTFACMGLVTIASAGIFWQLSPRDSESGAAADDVPDVPEHV